VSGLHVDYNRVVQRRHAYPNADPDGNSQSNGYRDRNTHRYGYSDAETYAYTTVSADTEASPYPGAAPVGLVGFERCI
jgi:hypothetical protein